MIEPLSDSEFEELDNLLLSDDLPEKCMDAVTLEGLLTAIAIGPVTVTPEHWLPQVFGSDSEDSLPAFPSIEDFERVVNLIMRYYNSVLIIFEIAPEKLSPTFYSREVEGKTYTIVDEWCSGFLQGIVMAGDACGSRCWMRSPASCGPSNYLPHRKAGPNWIRRRTRRRCMRSGPARLNRRSTPYMLTGYLIEKVLGKPCLCPSPRELRESRRWDAMHLAHVVAAKSTNIVVVPDERFIDRPIVNA